jgi:hypothetical protein
MLIADVWNSAIEKKDKPIQARSRVFASEIGGSMIDRYLKMKAEPYTNPPNSRSMRKFMSGDIWEWIIKTVLIRCGIPFEEQNSVKLEYPNLLPISGRIDFIVGGQIDYAKAKERLIEEDIPEFMKVPVEAIIKSFEETYPDGNLPKKIIEVKSVGSFVFEDLLSKDNPKTHHMYQACVYHLVKKIPTDIVYVCRDDCRLLQYSIDRIAPELEKEIIKDLELITKYHNEDIEPAKEELIIWDKDVKKFKTNWKVQYSCYLSKLYSYTNEEGIVKPIDQPDTYQDYFSPKVSSWNRVVKRLVEGKELTKSNEQYIEEIKTYGFDIKNLI